MLVCLNLVLTDQHLLPFPSGKFLRFLFCLQERLLSGTRSIRSWASLPLQGLCLPATLELPHPALFIPGASSQASHKSLPSSSILKWIVLLSLATTSASSTARVPLAAMPVGLCIFWHLEQACHGVPMSWKVSAWRGVVVLHGESLGWAQGTSQNCAQKSPSFRWITFIKLFFIGVRNGKLLRKKKGFEITWWQKITTPSTRDLWQCVGSGAAPKSRDSLKLRPFTGRDTLSSLRGFDVNIYLFIFFF